MEPMAGLGGCSKARFIVFSLAHGGALSANAEQVRASGEGP
jgi:hypothetical protein